MELIILQTSVDPVTAKDSAHGRLTPPRAVTPEVVIPDDTTSAVTRRRSLYSPSLSRDDYSSTESLDSLGTNELSVAD